MTLNERIETIKTNWLNIKNKDQKFSEKNNLQNVIDAKSIEAFEQQHGIELHEEYKNYLLNVSNGGPCISGQMYSLNESLQPFGKAQNLNHCKLDFVVTEEKIVEYLTNKIKNATKDIAPIPMDANAGGYLFLSKISEDSYYILALNGACKNEVFMLTKAEREQRGGATEMYFNLLPEMCFVENQIKTFSFIDWLEDMQKNWFNTNAELDKKLTAVKIMWYNFEAWDKDKTVFGAFMHHYKLNKTLTDNEIAYLENKYQFKLPEEYRQYLKIVSNGGVGPFYGMNSFEDAVMSLNSGSRDDGTFINYLEKNPDHFAKPFPVTDEQVNNYLLQKASNPSAASQPIKINKNAGGYLFLAEYGCGGYYIMPVNGNGAGEVWYLQKMNANKLTYELTDENGNLVQSGSYGDDEDDNYFELYPELKWNNLQASTVNFLEWLEYKQSTWFSENNDESESTEQEAPSEGFSNENAYHPLAIGNTWTYDFAGQQMINTIESCDNGVFIVSNSLNPVKGNMKKVNGEYFSDSYEKGNMQVVLKDNLVLGDQWDVIFKANGIDCVYKFTVKEIAPSKVIAGKEYKDVAMVESDSNMLINGNLVSINAFVQTYYAKGVGAVLTLTSGVIGVSETPLLSYDIK
ncbi:MAG: SMI1/KNR4 family protein [Bacteroidetes bacterium]|nr:SMI1/KNR4 family protein [Bacteroidota bacterium]